MPLPFVPYDILTRIIDQLASQGSYEDLRACSQTCRTLLHPCRVHLFSTVVVKDNAHHFADLLERNPTIANYLRELTYHTRVLSDDIANAFLLLNNIKTLVLRGAHDTYSDVREWTLLPPHLQYALIHLFNSPSITRIHIHLLEGLPAILLSSCSNLKHLKMTYCDLFSSEVPNIIIGVPPKLLSLHVINRETYNTMEELRTISRPDGLPILDLSGLRSLTIDINVMEDEIVLENILRLIHKLETLKCKVIQHMISDNLAKQLTIPLPSLRALHLQWILPFRIQLDSLALVKLLEALACQPNCINELRVFIRINCPDALIDQVWAPLDQILGDRPGFRQLEKLRIKLWSLHSHKAEEHIRLKFKEIKTTRLSQLLALANDYLEFRLSVDE